MGDRETEDRLLESTSDRESTETSPLIRDSESNSNNKSLPNSPQVPASGSEDVPVRTKSAAATLSLLLIGVFISNADATLVMTTYTTISSQFNSFKAAAWLTTSYTLASCAFQPIVGKLSDIYGRKGVLLVSYGIFAVGSVGTGLGQSIAQVIAGRVVSAIGAAGMSVIVSVLITDLVPLIQVASWRSYVNVFSTLGRSVGGPLGGFLADTVGWRWSFIGQGPLLLFAILLVALKLPSKSPVVVKGEPSKLRRIDFVGAFLLALTIIGFLGALSIGGQDVPWSHPLVWGLLIDSLVLGMVFVGWEVKCAFEPIFPPQLVIRRDIVTPYAISAFQTSAQVAMMFSVPLYFRVTQNASNTTAGAHLFPAVLGNTLGALLAGATIQRTGRYKLLTVFATSSSSLSYFLLILRWKGKISLLESLEIVPGGFGTGIASTCTFIALTSSLKHKDMAVATGGLYLSNAIGMLVGLSVSSAVQLSTLRVILEGKFSGDTGAKIIENVLSDVNKIGSLEEGIRNIVVKSYVTSLEYSHMVSLGSALIALLISFTIHENSLM